MTSGIARLAGHALRSSASAEAAVLLTAGRTTFPGAGLGSAGLAEVRRQAPGLAAGPPGEKAQAWLTDGSLPGERENKHISSTFTA